ncbi:MAG: T9SS type A sorting domain-containing protein [Bacteroidia bacterium]|nr:T9SS type A sorting domain-containing protein [Bacteroidia bacterium]
MTNGIIDGVTPLPGAEIFTLCISPNPMTSQTNIYFSNPYSSNYKLIIYNLLGENVKTITGITGSKIVLEKGNLKPGVYMVEVNGEKIFRGRVVIE